MLSAVCCIYLLTGNQYKYTDGDFTSQRLRQLTALICLRAQTHAATARLEQPAEGWAAEFQVSSNIRLSKIDRGHQGEDKCPPPTPPPPCPAK